MLTNFLPLDGSYEQKLQQKGLYRIAGVDEVGRGPLAGPVVAAAVRFKNQPITGLDDSKRLTARKREILFEAIIEEAEIGLCALPSETIDALNIRGASLLAMHRALEALPSSFDMALIDGCDVPNGINPAEAHIGGDGRIAVIAAASIVAKVIRDRMMKHADMIFPQYGFAQNAGYGTRTHLEALRIHGPCPLHRKSFAPVRVVFDKKSVS
jgi:ribonuclease HII